MADSGLDNFFEMNFGSLSTLISSAALKTYNNYGFVNIAAACMHDSFIKQNYLEQIWKKSDSDPIK